jgi:hypothetical protein
VKLEFDVANETLAVPGQTVTLALGTGRNCETLDDLEKEPFLLPNSSVKADVLVLGRTKLELAEAGGGVIEGWPVPRTDVALMMLVDWLAENCCGYPGFSKKLDEAVPTGIVELELAGSVELAPGGEVPVPTGKVPFSLVDVRLNLPDRFWPLKSTSVEEALVGMLAEIGDVELAEGVMAPEPCAEVTIAVAPLNVELPEGKMTPWLAVSMVIAVAPVDSKKTPVPDAEKLAAGETLVSRVTVVGAALPAP